MKSEQYLYDIYPLVFPVGQTVTITIKPLSQQTAFSGEYDIMVQCRLTGCDDNAIPGSPITKLTVTANEDGCLRIPYTAHSESEHAVGFGKNGKWEAFLWVYAVYDDLASRYPFRGDFHTHTCRSDGTELPAVHCANYRRRGYDFIAVTDHGRYYPSLEAINAFTDVKPALTVLPGEEVHLPGTEVHLVNVGGRFSVNGLVPSTQNYTETNGETDMRRLDDTVTPPNIRTIEEYENEIAQLEKELPIPANVDSHSYAVCYWAFQKIREAEGLGVYAHPFWLDCFTPEPFVHYMLESHPFDAFEVLGGVHRFRENGLQTALYYDEYRNGRVHPIVGSTDSHNPSESNPYSAHASTIVFAEYNNRESIINAVKNRYSVAIDTLNEDYRLVGEYRFQKYGAFLMENYFPLHDRQAALDGEVLCKFVAGNATAEEVNIVSAKAEKTLKKYILTK